MSTRTIASSVPPPRTWNEEILGSDKTRIAVLTCFVATAIITSLGYLGYIQFAYYKAAGTSLVVTGLILPHLLRWIELKRYAGQVGQTTIGDLPPEVLKDIFLELPPEDMLKISAICKQWYLLVGGHFSVEYVKSESSTIVKIRRQFMPGNFHGCRKLVYERLAHALKLQALSLAQEEDITDRGETFLLIRAIAQIHSTNIALAEAEKRLTDRGDRIWLYSILAQRALEQGKLGEVQNLMQHAQSVVNNLYTFSTDNHNYHIRRLKIEQDLLRAIAHMRMELGDQEGAISTIKFALSYFSFFSSLWRDDLNLASGPYGVGGPIELIHFACTLGVKTAGTWRLTRKFQKSEMYRVLHADLETLRANEQITVEHPTFVQQDQEGGLDADPMNNRLQEGKFHEAMEVAVLEKNLRNNIRPLLEIATSPHTTIHREDPYYKELFSSENNS